MQDLESLGLGSWGRGMLGFRTEEVLPHTYLENSEVPASPHSSVQRFRVWGLGLRHEGSGCRAVVKSITKRSFRAKTQV